MQTKNRRWPAWVAVLVLALPALLYADYKLESGVDSTLATVDPAFKALRVSARPLEVGDGGCYAYAGVTGLYSSLAANAEVFQMRWTDASHVAVIMKVSVGVANTVAASAAGIVDRQLIVARTWTVNGTGGTAISFAGNLQKLRASHSSSLVTDMRIATTAALGAGTKTLDGGGMGQTIGALGTAAITAYTAHQVIPMTDVFDAQSTGSHPLVLAVNEGIVIRMVNAQPTSSTMMTAVNLKWCEVQAY